MVLFMITIIFNMLTEIGNFVEKPRKEVTVQIVLAVIHILLGNGGN